MHPSPDSPALHVAPLLLAAGSAQRMGGRPKCLLEIEGQAILVRLIDAIAQAGLPAPVVVLGAYAQRIDQALRERNVQQVVNPYPGADQISSLRLGLAATARDADAVMVLLADQPLIRAQDLKDLIQAYRERPEGAQMVQPTLADLPGNPALLSRLACAQILAGPADWGTKQWRSQHSQAFFAWENPNPRYRTDLDSPQDIENLQSHWGIAARWPADLQDAL
jgi:molybdenum cofactor cytidylyltransferase